MIAARPTLAPEWQRIDVLAACVLAQRRGEAIDDELRERLRQTQEQVLGLRHAPPWDVLEQAGLSELDKDILAGATAPDAAPRLGWLYQELQPGLMSPYPTAALLRELLFVDEGDAPAFQLRLGEGGPLRRLGLLESTADPYQPLRPSLRARSALLGWPAGAPPVPPGAVELPVRAGWDDIVLPAACRRALDELVVWVRRREQVEREWRARPSGGPIALFSGPSGTGKTLAAEVFAGALGYRLLRVDLGLLVSKWIGETEKNLNNLLEAAASEPIVLLFDEADSLFGRRGDIKDARDRYANMEVSHLLTRIELHRGPCVLTTNLRQHLDSAFLRRFQAVIEFPRPDAVSRAALWRMHLPPGAPLGPEVSPERLGEAIALSGGQIRNAALRAALLACGESEVIGLGHVARSVWSEIAKDGHELDPKMLGFLAASLPEGYA